MKKIIIIICAVLVCVFIASACGVSFGGSGGSGGGGTASVRQSSSTSSGGSTSNSISNDANSTNSTSSGGNSNVSMFGSLADNFEHYCYFNIDRNNYGWRGLLEDCPDVLIFGNSNEVSSLLQNLTVSGQQNTAPLSSEYVLCLEIIYDDNGLYRTFYISIFDSDIPSIQGLRKLDISNFLEDNYSLNYDAIAGVGGVVSIAICSNGIPFTLSAI